MPSNPINISGWSCGQKQELLDSFETICADCDGVLWHDDAIIPGAPETINAILNSKKEVYFVTNNGTKTRSELWQKAKAFNFNIPQDHILSPTYAIAKYLASHLRKDQKVYIISTDSLTKELDSFGISSFGVGPDPITGNWSDLTHIVAEQTKSLCIGAVVVGFDPDFSYYKMMKASNFLGQNEKCIFLATNNDAVVKYPQFCVPGTGALVKAIETCVGREAFIMGKPNPYICKDLMESGKMKPHRTLMIGDCYKVDVLFGKNCGFKTLLVGTGRYKWQDMQELLQSGSYDYMPDFYADSIADLGLTIPSKTNL